MRKTFISIIFILCFSTLPNAQEIPPSYGFVEVVDSQNKPIENVSVRLYNGRNYTESQLLQRVFTETNEKGILKTGIPINYSDPEVPFQLSKSGFYDFTDCFILFDFLRGGWRDNKENPIKIELLKISQNKTEKKLIEQEQHKREFFLAARKGDTLAVKKFIKSKLNPNLTTSDLRGIPTKKEIPIILFAVKSGNGKTVKEFLSAGVKVNKTNEPINNILIDYLSAYPSKIGFPETEAGNTARNSIYEDGAINLIDAGANLESNKKDQITPLMLASQRYYLRIVKKLIQKGAFIDAQDNLGRTALMYLVDYYKPKQRLEIAESLIKAGANVNLLTSQTPYYKYNFHSCNTALTIAVQGVDVELVKLLIANGADVNLTCLDGNSALNYAKDIANYANNEKEQIIKILTEAGAK